MSTRTCRACGLSIDNVHGTTRYHSACREKRLPNHTCAICRRAYFNSHLASMYCSKVCSNHARLIPSEVRYWSLVQIGEPDECWPWKAAIDRYGYGVFTAIVGQQMAAHRFSYQSVHGITLTPEEKVLHTCIAHRWCQNPMHLYIGNVQDNADDMLEQERQVRGEAHYRARLTAQDVVAMRLRHRRGERIIDIAADYPHVAATTVHAAIHGETWKHL